MKKKKRRFKLTFKTALIVFVAVGVPVILVLLWKPWRPRTMQFYGLVVDENNQPVADAVVRVWVTKLAKGGMYGASYIPSQAYARTYVYRTDSRGRFSFGFWNRDYLRIEAVEKPGYDWVIDWVWASGEPYKSDNRYFQFNIPPSRGGYIPDAERPAIFPLHRTGCMQPVAYTSRGGWDMDGGRDRKENIPVKPLIPSAGPGAPKTSAEIGDQIGEFIDARSGNKNPIPKGGYYHGNPQSLGLKPSTQPTPR